MRVLADMEAVGVAVDEGRLAFQRYLRYPCLPLCLGPRFCPECSAILRS